jgi:hypothetical protein
MSSYFNEGQIEVHERVNSRWLADRMIDEVIHYTIGNSAHAYIEARDIFFLATVDAEGRANYSYKGSYACCTSIRWISQSTTAMASN